MEKTSDREPSNDLGDVCDLLDKLTLKQLRLMEDKLTCELNIESSINMGSINLAKSRYIMGHTSVSATRLPMESSMEFDANVSCESTDEDGVKQLKVVKNNGENTVNPMRWFGVLVPQNLYKAQNNFQNAISYVVECANIQLLIGENIKNIDLLKRYKKWLQ